MSARNSDGNRPDGPKKHNRQHHDGIQKSGGRRRGNRRATWAPEGSKCWDGSKNQHSGRQIKAVCAEKKTHPGGESKRSQEALPDLTPQLVRSGVYEEYRRWREGYRRWREGEARGACGEGGSHAGEAATTDGPLRLSKSWRDAYRSWRAGGARGARGEMEAIGKHLGRGRAATEPSSGSGDLPPVIFDVVAGEGGEPALVPMDGPEIAPILVKDFPTEAVLTVRVFRFLEDRSDESTAWERNLLNVNSGSIFWLPWHLAPNMHSKAGAKYGTWFTIHYVQVYAKHFTSAYHMCNEGFNGGAKTFGSSRSNAKAITGESMQEGYSYFWYVSPAEGKEHLRGEGWQHLDRAGPFDGNAFLRLWQEQAAPMGLRALQGILAKVVDSAGESKMA